MALFPLFADVRGREVLVVGGGEVAVRKIEALLHAGADVRVHARELHPQLAQWLAQGRLARRDGAFDAAWLDTAWLLVVATDDHAFNAQLAALADGKRKFANVVDDVQLSTYQVPAVIERGALVLAISSGGAAPMLARRLREKLETELDPALGELAILFARHRALIRERLPDMAQRRRWFDACIDGEVAAQLRNGRRDAAERVLLDSLRAENLAPNRGRISLVGVGPGAAAQLTLGALRAMNLADVVLHDADVSAEILALARKDAPREAASDDFDACVVQLRAHADAGRHAVWLKRGNGFADAPFAQLQTALEAAGAACETLAGVAG